MANSFKKTLYLLLEDQTNVNPRARWVRWFLVILILLNVAAVMLETMEELSLTYRHVFHAFELVSVGIFTVEYFARIYVCEGRDCGGWGRFRFMLRPLMLVDLLAILPFYLPLILPADLIFLRSIRLMRLARVLKLGRYSDAIHVFGQVIRLKKEQLVVSIFGIGILLIIASSCMYYAEHEAQPAVFSSIPHAMWWAVVTLTTVGYGDVYPVTAFGRVLGSFIALLGIGMFALPAGILSSGFYEYGERTRRGHRRCPKCGAPVDSHPHD